MKVFSSKNQKIGRIGEDIACVFLMKHNFLIIDRNYTRKWGEIDIIARKANVTHFIEVKSVSCEDLNSTLEKSCSYRPEEQLHASKRRKLARTIQTYLAGHDLSKEWVFDLVCVYIDQSRKVGRVKLLEDIII